MRGLRMTKQEIKEEYKRLEGDPMIKQRMRELQRQVAYQRMMAAVPRADVVVTNPIHIAVALKYEAPKMKAPMVLAKGERKAAEEIKQIADASYVPIVENEPLAQVHIQDYGRRETDPAENCYQAVAEVLAYVYKIEEKSRGEAEIIPWTACRFKKNLNNALSLLKLSQDGISA